MDSDSDSEFDEGDGLQSTDNSDDSDEEECPMFPTRNGEFHFVDPGENFRENGQPSFYGTPGMNPAKEIPSEFVSDEEKVRAFLDVFFTEDFFESWRPGQKSVHKNIFPSLLMNYLQEKKDGVTLTVMK